MYLFNYGTEQDAKRALDSLKEQLNLGLKYQSSLDAASTACEMLCIIAGSPDHFLGLELINVLNKAEHYSAEAISTMIAAFMINIQARIDHERYLESIKVVASAA